VNGVHDLGGTDGLGRVEVPESEPIFRADWEKAAFAMFSMCFRAGYFGVDEFRYGIEQMHPAVYLLSPYYEHWLHTVEHYGKAKGLLSPEDLCSCYPWPVLGLPPNWYKEPAYRARIVKEPRKVLREDFGYDVPDSVEVRVWDSSSEMRYWVLPTPPEGTEGLSEDELASLVTRDSMIGVGPAASPVS
jgi:hypothetical protein